MKRGKYIRRILLSLGCAPFLIAVSFCFISSLTAYGRPFWEYFILYSFLYWPTYVIGIVLMILSLCKAGKKH